MSNLNQKGFVAFFITILVLAVIFGIAISLTVLILGQQKISQNIVSSTQAYFASEAGIEDALLRLVKNLKFSSPYNLAVDEGSTTITISEETAGQRTITSEGNFSNRIRKIETVYAVSTEKTSFYYAAQIGDGGVEMKNNSQIIGNLFSNGSIFAQNLASVSGTVIVAKNGNQISGLKVKKDAKVDICTNSEVDGTLTCRENNGCTASKIEALTSEISPVSPPISTSTIEKWKKEAASGGEISSLTLSGDDVLKLGPKKIEGYLLIKNQAKLIMTGTIWVTGNIHLQNNAILELDSGYGTKTGVIIADGTILIENNAIARGSGQAGSYLMLLSTNPSLDPSNPAIEMKNLAKVDILNSQNGLVPFINNANLRSIYAFKLSLENNITLTYEVGLESTEFSSGPGGSKKVISWKEIE